jgi:hypothetical protein
MARNCRKIRTRAYNMLNELRSKHPNRKFKIVGNFTRDDILCNYDIYVRGIKYKWYGCKPWLLLETIDIYGRR